MGNRGHVSDIGDLVTHIVQRSNGRFATRPGTLDFNVQVFKPILLRGQAGPLCRYLRSKRRTLARTAKA